jgi:putative spermidine/putrescine transport system ATP-binding protein
LSASGLTKAFGPARAVTGFSLAVADGEYVALLGPSGCGKTTVLRMIAGITRPDAGEIRLSGQRIDALPPERRNIGLVFQSYALFPHMTVERNVAFGLRMRGVTAADVARRVTAALALVDLGGLGARYPRELSGGQQQRVALARALAIEPQVLLLDEPMSNLDAKLREQLRDELRALQRRLGITTIHVTHDQAEALALADRVVVMNDGRIVEDGTPRALYSSPRTRFAAEFLGHTNIIPATLVGGHVVAPWGQPLGPAPLLPGWVEGRSLTLSVRPEDLTLSPRPDGPGRVVDATFLGAGVETCVAVGDMMLRCRSAGRGAVDLPPGSPVAIGFPADLHLLAVTPDSATAFGQDRASGGTA